MHKCICFNAAKELILLPLDKFPHIFTHFLCATKMTIFDIEFKIKGKLIPLIELCWESYFSIIEADIISWKKNAPE